MLNVRSEVVVVTLDIKDAFLMAAQPEAEKAYVQIDDRIYKLLRWPPQDREQLLHNGSACLRRLAGTLEWSKTSCAAHADATAQHLCT